MTDLKVLILTKNEESTLEKCVSSVASIAKRVVVVDSYSDDKTELVAKKLTNS
ncbi:MAG: glycosyltransferase [Lachnospiraceae bacterium]|nr:glycosyltransferase [Lachnospiraceae bacterium]